MGLGYAHRTVDVVSTEQTTTDETTTPTKPTMRVVVDDTLCEGNGRCVAAASTVFSLPDDVDQVQLLVAEPGEDLRSEVERAIRVCPRGALSLADQ